MTGIHVADDRFDRVSRIVRNDINGAHDVGIARPFLVVFRHSLLRGFVRVMLLTGNALGRIRGTSG